MYWNANKNEIISTVVGVGAIALTTGLAVVTGGTSMLLVGVAVGAFQSGLDSYLNQRNSGFAVDWGTVGKESLKGGIISGIAGGIGGVMANVAKPLNFCGKAAMEIAGDVLEHWAIGTAGDTAVGMIATYVSERFDGKSPQEAFQSTMSSADDILLNAALTSAAGTAFDSFTAPKCFVAGTMVVTAGGLVAIENIQPGDVVLAANEETGEVAYKEVVRTFVNTTDEITHVTIENAEGEQETIDSSPEHPFYVEGLGWVEASSLHAGMTIWFANGTKGTVEDISNEGLEEPVTVYNFEVKDFHTYFVGEYGVLVHNTCATLGVDSEGVTSGDEVYYRTMSEEDYDYLRLTGELPATSETFISPTESYSRNYSGVTVEFELTSGTTSELESIGLRNNARLAKETYPDMESVSGIKWTEDYAFFKAEGDQINIGLGKGKALEIFNSNILNFTKLGDD